MSTSWRAGPTADSRGRPSTYPAGTASHVAGSGRAPTPGPQLMTAPALGSLTWLPAAEHPELLGGAVPAAVPTLAGPAWVTVIDDDLADTAAFTEAYDVPPEASANCVVVAARRAGQ